MYLDSVQQSQMCSLLYAYHAQISRRSCRYSDNISRVVNRICFGILVGIAICWWQEMPPLIPFPWMLAAIFGLGIIGQRIARHVLIPLPSQDIMDKVAETMAEEIPTHNASGCFLFGQMLCAWDNRQPEAAIEFMEECQEEFTTWPYWGIVSEVLFSD